MDQNASARSYLGSKLSGLEVSHLDDLDDLVNDRRWMFLVEIARLGTHSGLLKFVSQSEI
jgi:hypothetical protein